MSVSTPTGQFFALADLGIDTSQGALLARWQNAMQAAFGAGWTPNPASLEYIQAQVFASWAADLGQLCSAGSMELFRQFGTQLLALPYEQGTPALAIATVTAVNTAGYTLPQGTQFTLTLNGALVAFATTSPLTIPAASSSGTVTLASIQSGTAYDGATTPLSLVSQIDWVSSVTLVTNASGGVDQEPDDAYVQRLAQTLTTLGVATATATAMATRALDFVPASGTDQEVVGRSTAIDGYSPNSSSFTVTANSTPTLTVTSAPVGLTAAPGASISGTDISASTIVNSSTSSTIVMSKTATGSASGITATVTGTLGNERTITLCVTDASGNALNSDTMTAVAAYLAGFRESGFIINVVAPAYSTVYVTVTVSAQPGYATATVQANVQAALLAYLSPANFGLPQGAIQGWQNTQTVFLSQLNAVIQNTLGVANVHPGTLAVGLAASPTNTTADLVLGGAFPLPQTTTTSIPTSGITVA